MDKLVSYKLLKDGEVNCLSVPMVWGFMTGTIGAMQNKEGIITLVYEDNSKESALLPDVELIDCKDAKAYFHIVGEVQERRGRGQISYIDPPLGCLKCSG